MKKVVWFFSVLYVIIPGIVVWMGWANQLTFVEGWELKGKWLLTILWVVVSGAACWAAWSSYLKWKKIWGEK